MADTDVIDYAGDAYRACLAGTADKNQQQAVASRVILLNAKIGRLTDAAARLISVADERAINAQRIVVGGRSNKQLHDEGKAALEALRAEIAEALA